MDDSPRFLTKSRFKVGLECPARLYYAGKPLAWADRQQEDDFLQALADGGFQVGELAKRMFPEGIEVTAAGNLAALEATDRLLERENVTIFEAAIRFGPLFVRADILRKTGDDVELVEVKAKGHDFATGLKNDARWRPYLQDVAFQRHVLRQAFPHWRVSGWLMLADKGAVCSVDGLNQSFRIQRQGRRTRVVVDPALRAEAIDPPLLRRLQVDDLLDEIEARPLKFPGGQGRLEAVAAAWADAYAKDERIPTPIGPHCGKCPFDGPEGDGLPRSGLRECWSRATGVRAFPSLPVVQLWNARPSAKQDWLGQGKFFVHQLQEQDFVLEPAAGGGLSPGQRQWMAVSRRWPGGGDFFLDRERVRAAMAGWRFPLHFIDFETASVALPFHAGQKPYASVAFQFSHHVMQADGSVAHANEFLGVAPGRSPNLDFVRALRDALGEEGTVFMWTGHERTTLNRLREELLAADPPPPHRDALCAFLATLLPRKPLAAAGGERLMVDLCELAKAAFLHPATGGSSSIKKVLPAVLESSLHLQARYGLPIYGGDGGIPSRNFSGMRWWQLGPDGSVMDPYKLLPPIFADLEPPEGEDDDEAAINQGGAAATAYARLQFEERFAHEHREVAGALKRYCELDTLAMVMVVEAWRAWCAGA